MRLLPRFGKWIWRSKQRRLRIEARRIRSISSRNLPAACFEELRAATILGRLPCRGAFKGHCFLNGEIDIQKPVSDRKVAGGFDSAARAPCPIAVTIGPSAPPTRCPGVGRLISAPLPRLGADSAFSRNTGDRQRVACRSLPFHQSRGPKTAGNPPAFDARTSRARRITFRPTNVAEGS